MSKTVNKTELAKILGVTQKTLTEWQAEDPPMPMTKGKSTRAGNTYDTAKVIAWMIERQIGKRLGSDGHDKLDAAYEKARKDKEAADKLALENRVRRGELLEAAEVLARYGQLVHAARTKLRSIGSKLAKRVEGLPALKIRAEIDREIDEALTELSES